MGLLAFSCMKAAAVRALIELPKWAGQHRGALPVSPKKDALVAALIARHNKEMLQLLRCAMRNSASYDLESAITGLVRAMIAVRCVDVDAALHRIFTEGIPLAQLSGINLRQSRRI
jgi:hypothetical protein